MRAHAIGEEEPVNERSVGRNALFFFLLFLLLFFFLLLLFFLFLLLFLLFFLLLLATLLLFFLFFFIELRLLQVVIGGSLYVLLTFWRFGITGLLAWPLTEPLGQLRCFY